MPRPNHNPKTNRMFEPAFLGPLAVKNRLIMPPMATLMASEVGGSPRSRSTITRRGQRGVQRLL
jgi:2,4-dienoyl-CoA reductase-like NADH-dependent reductase (Old Yellow Enzyme family)